MIPQEALAAELSFPSRNSVAGQHAVTESLSPEQLECAQGFRVLSQRTGQWLSIWEIPGVQGGNGQVTYINPLAGASVAPKATIVFSSERVRGIAT